MRRVLFVLGALLVAHAVLAQPIHQHPQKAAYASPSEYPLISGQCHWAPAESVLAPHTLVRFLGHTHVEPRFPYDAVMTPTTGPITVPFELKLFHTDGEIDDVFAEYMGPNGRIRVSNLVVDQTLPLVGDPNGLVTFTGHLVLDWKEAAPEMPLNGWTNVRLVASTSYNTGSAPVDTALWLPLYSLIDLTQPQVDGVEGGGQLLRINCQTLDISAVTDFHDAVPFLAPINSVWTEHVFGYNYGVCGGATSDCGTAVYEMRVDPNLHMGIVGTLIDTVTSPGGTENIDTFDPAVLGLGTHRLSFNWSQLFTKPPVGDGFVVNDQIVSILAFDVTVVDANTSAPQQPSSAGTPTPTPTSLTLTVTSSLPSCTGTVVGTQTGSTVAVKSGSLVCR